MKRIKDISPCIIQNALHRVRPRSKSGEGVGHNDYLQYVLSAVSSAGWFDALNDKATIAHFTAEKFGALSIPLPSPVEQAAIARFLDHANQRIHRYIRAKEKLIELLEEQQQVIIHQAVTGQIDVRTGQPYPSYKTTAVEWLGEVPSHWGIRRIGSFSAVGNGSTPSRSNSAYWLQGTHAWLTSSCVNQDRIIEANQFVTDVAMRECHLPKVSAGSVLVGITGQGRTRGMAAILGINATINQHIAYITPYGADVSPYYLHMVLTAAYSELRAISNASGSTREALTCQDVSSFKVTVPPLAEQTSLLAVLRERVARIDRCVAVTEQKCSLVRQYRARLIANIVTGKLDVREATSALPADLDACCNDNSPSGDNGTGQQELVVEHPT